jgi:hypothetical protein
MMWSGARVVGALGLSNGAISWMIATSMNVKSAAATRWMGTARSQLDAVDANASRHREDGRREKRPQPAACESEPDESPVRLRADLRLAKYCSSVVARATTVHATK